MKKLTIPVLSIDKKTIAKLDEKQLMEIFGGIADQTHPSNRRCPAGQTVCDINNSTGCSAGNSLCKKRH